MHTNLELNPAQQEAVDHIYGPLLVLAGPGTGKTQLLSARIANILKRTDANAQNILCLTFTESAAHNMRERLSSIIGADAYDVHIGTYHSFGSDIIRSYPDYFEEIDLESGKDTRLEKPVNDIQQIQILSEIVHKLPYDSPLLSARHFVKSLLSTISELKRGLYTPNSLRELAQENLRLCQEVSPKIADILQGVKRFPSKADQSIALFEQVYELLQGYDGLGELACDELEHALALATDINSSKPLTAWKDTWLKKDAKDRFLFTDHSTHIRMVELARVYEQYQAALAAGQLYDYDDMILRAIDSLKHKADLRFSLQEKYQFILLDEFQDTNAAQFELVRLLGDNPVNEGQPNIFAVGDDDQAIYAFQGAHASNMLQFLREYRSVKVVNLTENYRSHADIIHVAHGIASQIESRLHHAIEGVNKVLSASSISLPKSAAIERHEFEAEANERSWIAHKIAELIKSGVSPDQIAILAPQHKYLETAVPFLIKNNIPIAYERRENILETPLIQAISAMVSLIIAVSENDEKRMSQEFPKVLSLEFFNIPVMDIWQVNWGYARHDNSLSWAELAMQNKLLSGPVEFFLRLGLQAQEAPLEHMLDYLTGGVELKLAQDLIYSCPLKTYYFSNHQTETLRYYELLAHLSTIREHLRAFQQSQEMQLKLFDYVRFIDAYKQAEQPLIHAHPVAQAQKAVQLMTAYKAKGLEFEHVFLLSMHDDVWGKSARGNRSKISLPANLQHVRYQGSSEDELKRILFVAITRAKHGLYLTSHALKDNGRTNEPIKYLLEGNVEGEDTRLSQILPPTQQKVLRSAFSAMETYAAVEAMWHSRHVVLQAELVSLLRDRLDRYQMSPTHLNSFIDLEHGGPENFLLTTLLRFPQAPSEDGEYGNAIHGTLEWLQKTYADSQIDIKIERILKEYDRQLTRRFIRSDRIDHLRARGHAALSKYVAEREEMLLKSAKTEVDFRNEGVLIGSANISGKIDRLEIDSKTKTLRIVDFKTGPPHTKWERILKLLKYKQQLYFYKFLIEGSHSWSTFSVESARLEFIEPNSDGVIVPPLYITFDAKEELQMKRLIQNVFSLVHTLHCPETHQYTKDYSGSQKFIADLIDKTGSN